MIRLKDILLRERKVSDILYHKTSINGIVGMLKDNKIHFTFSVGTNTDNKFQKLGKYFYLSCSRIKLGGYARGIYEGWVNLVLDGRQLGYNLSSQNVDYWGNSFRKMARDTPEGTPMTPQEKERFMGTDENEERIISSKPFIKGVKKYIKEIHSYVGDGDVSLGTAGKWLPVAEKLAKARNIPIFFYTDKSAAKTLNKRKAYTSLTQIQAELDMDSEPEVYKPRAWSHDRLEKVKVLISILDKRPNAKWAKNEIEFIQKVTGYERDTLAALDNEIHNAKTTREKEITNTFMKLSKTMKRLRVNTTKQLVYIAVRRYFEMEGKELPTWLSHMADKKKRR